MGTSSKAVAFLGLFVRLLRRLCGLFLLRTNAIGLSILLAIEHSREVQIDLLLVFIVLIIIFKVTSEIELIELG